MKIFSVSKKRVLGECSACHKPVTAGARQMHMFFHLGKDHNTYRFRCKHPGCNVEHYRKDQMENHHSKVHGKIEAEMMEDRSLELYDMCQKMSMELLGTVGNTPGPTAAKAQIMYDNMQREAELSALRKRKRNRGGGNNFSSQQNYFGSNQQFYNGNSANGGQFDSLDFNNQFNNNRLNGNNNFFQQPAEKATPTVRLNEETLECQLCQKKIMNRVSFIKTLVFILLYSN